MANLATAGKVGGASGLTEVSQKYHSWGMGIICPSLFLTPTIFGTSPAPISGYAMSVLTSVELHLRSNTIRLAGDGTNDLSTIWRAIRPRAFTTIHKPMRDEAVRAGSRGCVVSPN